MQRGDSQSRVAVVIFKAKKRAVCTDGNNQCITSSGTGSVDTPVSGEVTKWKYVPLNLK